MNFIFNILKHFFNLIILFLLIFLIVFTLVFFYVDNQTYLIDYSLIKINFSDDIKNTLAVVTLCVIHIVIGASLTRSLRESLTTKPETKDAEVQTDNIFMSSDICSTSSSPDKSDDESKNGSDYTEFDLVMPSLEEDATITESILNLDAHIESSYNNLETYINYLILFYI